MRRKQVLSLFMLVLGVAMLVAAISVGAASSTTKKAGSAEANKGGTLKVNQAESDFDFVDPQLAYRTDDWAMIYTTSMPLVGFQEKAGAAGAQLVPIGATAFPTVTGNGKTYTFHVRPGLKFSDGSPVTAAAYQRSWERILSPKMGSPVGVNIHLESEIAGGTDFLNGKTQHISGVTAKGLTLTSEQAAKFWPLFDQFQKEQDLVVNEQIQATDQYAKNYENLSDEGALAYVNSLLSRDKKMYDLRLKWLARFQQVIPVAMAARAIQLDRRLGNVTQVQLSQRIPLIH